MALVILFSFIAVLAVAAIVGAVRLTLTDGYHRVPTRRDLLR
jgi:hypothetical protein